MNIHTRFIALCLAAVLTTACGAPSQPDPEETTVNQPPFAFYKEETRTGVQQVDRVIEAMAKKDAETLTRLMKSTTTSCTTQRPDAPPCPDGAPEGTPIETWGATACRRTFSGPGINWGRLVPEQVEKYRQLVAVYKVNPSDSVFGQAYAIVYAEPQGGMWTIYLDASGSFVGQNLGCNLWDLEVVMKTTDFILRPNPS